MLFLFIPVGAPTVVWAEFPPVTSLYAPQNQAMICGELDRLTPAAFQTEIRDCLVDYYEKVCGMAGHRSTPKAIDTEGASTPKAIDTEGASDTEGATPKALSTRSTPKALPGNIRRMISRPCRLRRRRARRLPRLILRGRGGSRPARPQRNHNKPVCA